MLGTTRAVCLLLQLCLTEDKSTPSPQTLGAGFRQEAQLEHSVIQGVHGSHPLVKVQGPLGVFYESNSHGGAGQWNPGGLESHVTKSCDRLVWKAERTV